MQCSRMRYRAHLQHLWVLVTEAIHPLRNRTIICTRHSGDGGGGGAESDDDDNASSTGSCVRLGPGDELRDDDQSTVSCFVLDKAARGMPRHSSGGGSAAQQY
eukprot:TRINITY_DN779_c0_g1_i3.p5 TRINITY_DN779_c0_g1~~TRINITY_DN779_c0_g1_i3.p5  ORF type:complete len:103 (-),score=26.17 TRINITY_DN779_c0_g1_i3:626-934(-)